MCEHFCGCINFTFPKTGYFHGVFIYVTLLCIIQQHTNTNKDNDEILHDVLKRQTGNDCQCKDGIPGPKGPPGKKGEMGERGHPGRQGKRGDKNYGSHAIVILNFTNYIRK